MSEPAALEPRWCAVMHGNALYGLYDSYGAAVDAAIKGHAGVMNIKGLVTTDQAEAYAAAKRPEYYADGHAAGWCSALEAAIAKVTLHGGSVEIEAAIRALIPK
uniref:hypothetical protein n=1 Tax=Castellaniella defragrans TaxID=75697 RepID=UPI0033418936